jgi:hypothetical protein
MNLEFRSSKSPNSQTIWAGIHSLEALTRLASLSPSPASGRGFYNAKIGEVFDFSSLHSHHTTQHQNSLLPTSGEGSGMRVENVAVSSVIAKNSSFLAALGEDILDHKTHLLAAKDSTFGLAALRAGSLQAWSQLHPYRTLMLKARA